MENLILFFNQISLENIISFILEPEFEGIFLVIKIIFIIISSVFIGGMLYLLTTTTWLRHRYSESLTEFSSYETFDARKALKQWAKVAKRLESNKEEEHKKAVIEANNLLKQTLKRKGYKGKVLEDLLKQIDSGILSDIDDVLEADKIYNNIVDDPEYKLSSGQAKKIVGIFEEAFENLESSS